MYMIKYDHTYPLFVSSNYSPVPTTSSPPSKLLSFVLGGGLSGDNPLSPLSAAHM